MQIDAISLLTPYPAYVRSLEVGSVHVTLGEYYSLGEFPPTQRGLKKECGCKRIDYILLSCELITS